MNRTEHLDWAKLRAMEYLEGGKLVDAISSFTSDLRKHDELANHIGLNLGAQLLMGGFMNTKEEVKKWIDDFN